MAGFDPFGRMMEAQIAAAQIRGERDKFNALREAQAFDRKRIEQQVGAQNALAQGLPDFLKPSAIPGQQGRMPSQQEAMQDAADYIGSIAQEYPMGGVGLQDLGQFAKMQEMTAPKAPEFAFQTVQEGPEAVTYLYNKQNPLERMEYGRGQKSPSTQVNIDSGKQATEFEKKVGSGLGEDYINLQRAADSTRQMDAKYDHLAGLLKESGSGPLRPLTARGAALIEQTLGLKLDPTVGAAEASRQVSNQLALSMRSTASGEGMPGQLSDKDREFLVASFPSLSNNPAAIPIMAEMQKKLNAWKRNYAAKAREYRRQNNGQFDEYFQDWVRPWVEANPVFTQADRAKVSSLQGQGQAQGQAPQSGGIQFVGWE